MEMNDQSKYVVREYSGVLSFVGPKGSEPVPLKDKEIKEFFGEVGDKEGRELITTSYKVGDSVKVISGPFIDFTGNVEEVNDEKQKVKVVVSILEDQLRLNLIVSRLNHKNKV